MKIDLGDFVSVEEREELVEQLLTGDDSIVVLDASHLKQGAGNHEYDQLLLFAKIFAERLRQYGRELPLIQLIAPKDPFVIDLKRIDELRRVSGVKIEIV